MKLKCECGHIIEYTEKDVISGHRLLCGDSTDSDSVAKLMNGQKADITFTSPPYNAGNNRLGGNKNKTESKYANSKDDDVEQWFDLVCASSGLAIQHSIFAFINVQQLANNKFRFIDYLHFVKEWFVDEMIWYKGEGNPALAPGVLNSRFEKIIILKNEAFPSRAINTVKFRGTISNVYQGGQQTKNEYSQHHAATFPVHLPAHFINSFTMQSVLDLFMGTGTTMVAANQLNRKCYGMEIDPKYCQVIIDRMRKLDPEIVIKKNGVVIDKI
jgi:DNA modification methylase